MARLRHMVVIVPGIGGSVLERGGTAVWGQGPLGIAARALDPGVLARFEGDGIRATGLVHAPAVLPGFTALRAYDELVRRIVNRFAGVVVDHCHPDAQPVAGANVLCVPYDFRRSLVDCADQVAATVGARLDAAGLSDAERRGRVVVIGHSMGGLVARWWLGPGGGGPLGHALLTLGTPHRGAPKALEWLVNGVQLKGLRLAGATEVIRTWPAAYELLPRYEAVLDTATGRHLRPHELVVDGFDHQAAGQAFAVHQDIERAWDGAGDQPAVTAMLGRYQPTLERASLTEGRLRVEKQAAEWLPDTGWAGDGSVPCLSAVPLEQAAGPPLPSVRHSALPELEAVVEWLEALEAPELGAVRGPGHARPTLALDVDEWFPAGEPIEVAALARGAGEELEGPEAGARLWVTARPADGGRAVVVELQVPTGAGGRWTGEMAGLAPGTYELALSGPGRAGGEAAVVREVIEVVEA